MAGRLLIPILTVAERGHEQETAAIGVAGDQGFAGQPPAVSRVADAGTQPAVRQQLRGQARFGDCGLVGILDVGETLAGQLGSLALGVIGRYRQRQPAQQRPELLPATSIGTEVRAQRRPGLLRQRA